MGLGRDPVPEALQHGFPLSHQTEAEGVDEGLRVWPIIVSKLAAALGVSAGYKGFVEAIEQVLGHDLQRLGQHIDNGQWGKAGRRLGNILDKLTSKRFEGALNDKVGKKLAGKILAQVGSKAIPFVGWGLFGASLIWTLAEQWF